MLEEDNSFPYSVSNIFSDNEAMVDAEEKSSQLKQLNDRITVGNKIKEMTDTEGWKIIVDALKLQKSSDFNVIVNPNSDLSDFRVMEAKNRYNLVDNLLGNIEKLINSAELAKKELAEVQNGNFVQRFISKIKERG